jgi:hypothetical protein
MCGHITITSIQKKTTQLVVSAAHCRKYAELSGTATNCPEFSTLDQQLHRFIVLTRIALLAGTIVRLSDTVTFTADEEAQAARAMVNKNDIDRILVFVQGDINVAFDGHNGDAAFAASFWCIFLDFLAGGIVFDNNNNNNNNSEDFRSPQTLSYLLQQHTPEVLRAKCRGLSDMKKSTLAAAGLDINIGSVNNIMKHISSGGLSEHLGFTTASITAENVRQSAQSAFRNVIWHAFNHVLDKKACLLREMLRPEGYTWTIPSDMWLSLNEAFMSVIQAPQM